MRLLLSICVAVFLFMYLEYAPAATPTGALDRPLIIGISPYLDEAEHKAQSKALLKFLTGMDAGDRAMLMDAYHLEALGEFIVPESKAYQHPKARLMKNKAVVGKLFQLPQSVKRKDTQPLVKGAVRLPQFLRYVAQNYGIGEALDVVVIGSPFYAAPEDKAHSMADGLIPGDGHFKHSRSLSVFGLADQTGLLKGVRVHFALAGDNKMQSDPHEHAITRFWHLYVTQQQGEMISFTADRETVFRKLKHNTPAIQNEYQRQETDRLEMIRLRQRELKKAIYDRPLSQAILPLEQLQQTSAVEIGLTWDCTCDLDLYVRPSANAEVIYFGKSRTKEGMYFKDFRKSPSQTNGFETVELTTEVDLRTVQIAVNLYRGAAPQGVQGEIRIAVDGHIYAKAFTINAASGNKGAYVRQSLNAKRSQAPQVVLIDPLSVIAHR